VTFVSALGNNVSDGHQIMDDDEFWTRLEFYASHWLENSDDRTLRRFWIDGFLPQTIRGTKRGTDVEGMAWVYGDPQIRHPYRFIVSVPQKMMHSRRQTFSIEQLTLDNAQQTLRIEVVSEKQVA